MHSLSTPIYRSGYNDGSGPECVTDGNNHAVLATQWGCGCCKPAETPGAVAFANEVARKLNTHAQLVAALERCAFLLEIASAEIAEKDDSDFEYDGSTCDATGHRTDCENAIHLATAALSAAKGAA